MDLRTAMSSILHCENKVCSLCCECCILSFKLTCVYKIILFFKKTTRKYIVHFSFIFYKILCACPFNTHLHCMLPIIKIENISLFFFLQNIVYHTLVVHKLFYKLILWRLRARCTVARLRACHAGRYDTKLTRC